MISLVDVVKAVDLILTDDGDSKKTREVFHSHGSMIKLINKFIITPTIVVSNSVKGSPAVKDVIEYNVSLFTSLYTQVFTTLVALHGLKPEVAFELLSSSYETTFGTGIEDNIDSFEKLLIAYEDDLNSFLPGLEAGKTLKTNKKAQEFKTSSKDTDKMGTIGKLITREVEIDINIAKDGTEKKLVIPIIIRANVIYVPFSSIENLLSKDTNEDFLDRLDDYRAGAITLKDLIFATDLVKDYKERRLKDSDDLLRSMRKRDLLATSKYAKHNASGFSRYYQMLIIGNDDEVRLQRRLRGSLTKPRVKEAFLDETSSLSVAVIDNDYERVVFYINDLADYVDLSFKELGKKKDSTDNMEELLKLLSSGRTL